MKALIVSSYDKSVFPHLDSVRFFEYLVNEVGMIKDDIVFYGRAEYEAKLSFYNVLFRICELSKDEPLIVYYTGHGLKTSWSFKKNTSIPYEIIFYFLEKRNAPLIFINDCCFGMVAADFMKEIKYAKMLIGLAPKNRLGESDKKSILLREIFRYWRKGLSANPRFCIEKGKYCRYSGKKIRKKICLRWGDNLDRLVFPLKIKKKQKFH